MRISCLTLALPSIVLLAGAAAADGDPTPEAIMDKYVEVTGGRAAYEKVKSEVVSGTLEISGMGLSGTLTSYRALPDKSYTLIELGAAGTAEEGSDGKVAWSVNGMQGPRIKEGEERAVALRNSAFHIELRWRDFFKKAALAGTEDVGGKPCYKVVLTPNEGHDETRYFEKESNLLVKIVVPTETPDGLVTAELTLSDYRDEGGFLSPHTLTQKLPNAEVVIKITGIKRNTEIAANRFDMPAEVKALLPGAAASSEKKDEKK